MQKSAVPVPLLAQGPTDSASIVTRPPSKNTLADWTAEADENDVNRIYGGEKRQRGGRKKRKKNKEESQALQNWDDIYDPSRPNIYEDYKHSDEKIVELREWKDRLYVHRMARRRDSDSDSSGKDYNLDLNSKLTLSLHTMSAYFHVERFAPPPTFDDGDNLHGEHQVKDVMNDSTGDDAYERRMRLSGTSKQAEIPESHPPIDRPATEVPLPPQVRPEAVQQSNTMPSISRAPVRYNLPVAPSEIPSSEAELEHALQEDVFDDNTQSDAAPRSLRPGQKGFAERLMSKYGWSKGSGLGASGSGIVNPLRVQLEKQKKKPDSEGGGFVGPGGRGKIVGGKKKEANHQEGKFGAMSEVVVLYGMVDGMNLDDEMESSDQGGLMQEIGDECGDKVRPSLFPLLCKI